MNYYVKLLFIVRNNTPIDFLYCSLTYIDAKAAYTCRDNVGHLLFRYSHDKTIFFTEGRRIPRRGFPAFGGESPAGNPSGNQIYEHVYLECIDFL